MTPSDVIVVGGGAAGFFAAITAGEAGASVTLLERGREVLTKVKISGGGRCNVTHACFEPKSLVGRYPRGGRELLGPFHRFQPRDTMAWFQERGVDLKTEPDGRVFPSSDQSTTIIEALTRAARKAGVVVKTGVSSLEIDKDADGFRVTGDPRPAHGGRQGLEERCFPSPVGPTVGGIGEKHSVSLWRSRSLLIATGNGPQGYVWARRFGHSIVPLVPSLFTFVVDDPRLRGLAGVAVPNAELSLEGTDLHQSGPVLITHWGLSGPAVLTLSAWGARFLSETGYKAKLHINWVSLPPKEAIEQLKGMRTVSPRQSVGRRPAFPLPHRLWERLVGAARVGGGWADLSSAETRRLVEELTNTRFDVCGKGTFKEEFVTAGGVPLKEVDFSTMESRRCSGLHFAGEILDIDGVTGGFNFQSAWTTGWLAGRAMAKGR